MKIIAKNSKSIETFFFCNSFLHFIAYVFLIIATYEFQLKNFNLLFVSSSLLADFSGMCQFEFPIVMN